MSIPSIGANTNGDYLVILSGNLRRAPYLESWKKFKDHIRSHLEEQPGWTDVVKGKTSGEIQGWCKLKNSQDVINVYDGCSKQAVVHVFATGLRNGYYDLLKCNCNQYFGLGEKDHSPVRSGIDVEAVNIATSRSHASSAHYAAPTQPTQAMYPTYPYASYYQTQSYMPASVHPYAMPSIQPAYSQSSGGLPVNLSRGAVVTEPRGVFIQGLNYSVGNTELHALLNGIGLVPEQARVHKDTKGYSKGVASAKFSTKAQAEYAVSVLNGRTHVGKTITVRMDVNSTVIGSLEPLVVDGTKQEQCSDYQ
ncbi:hypothetical protein N0V90_013281 [Kalmusia sp. IMI 367209]|nr:hypothetical protein N0V90_013281 [Kalmusia sp. IMI 367209]